MENKRNISKRLVILALVLIILVSIIYFYLFAKQQLKKFDKVGYEFVGVKNIKVRPNLVTMTGLMEIDNTMDMGAYIYDQIYDVFIDGVAVSRIRVEEEVFIPQNEKTVIPLNIQISPAQLMSASAISLSNIVYKPSNVDVRIKGLISIRKGFVRIRGVEVDFTDSLKYYIELAKSYL